MQSIAPLHFHGPFKFVGDHSVAQSPYAASEGIYLWTITDGTTRYIHYVGETTHLLKRHKEHLTQILGLNYGLFRPDSVAANDPTPIYGGMWRDKSADPLTKGVANWRKRRDEIVPYLESLEIFFAPTCLPRDVRRHVEGSISRSLRDKPPNESRFYPADNRTGTKKAKLSIKVSVTSDSPICGLDEVLEV